MLHRCQWGLRSHWDFEAMGTSEPVNLGETPAV